MWTLVPISIVLCALASAHPIDQLNSQQCHDESNTVSIFTDGETSQLTTLRRSVTSLDPEALKNLTSTELHIVADDFLGCTQKVLDIDSTSFQGPQSIRNVVVISVILRGLPSPFSSFKSLKSLDLARNNFTEFPKEFCANIPTLENLSIRRQKIRSLSSDSLSTIADGLTSLYINSCELRDISAQCFKRFSRLDTLNLQKNQLTTISPDMFDGLQHLTYLSLHENQLTEIKPGTFADLLKLQEIDLEKNRLEILPHGIFNGLKMLERLALRGNPLKVISHNFLQGLSSLANLSLGFGKAIEIEENALGRLALTSLTLDASDLSSLEANSFNGSVMKTLILNRTSPIDFRRNLFRGLQVQEVFINEAKKENIDKESWGLNDNAIVYSVTKPYELNPFVIHVSAYESS